MKFKLKPPGRSFIFKSYSNIMLKYFITKKCICQRFLKKIVKTIAKILNKNYNRKKASGL